MYQLLKSILFRFDPERVHDFFIWFGHALGATPAGRAVVGWFCRFRHSSLRTVVNGVSYDNPVGLGAGFDKDMQLTEIMPSVGFGFMEVGAVTHHPYAGNDGLRLARLPKDQSIIVYYGLKNIGAPAILEKSKRLSFAFPVGLNVAKTNRADIVGDASVADYVATYRLLAPHFSYVTLNVSCPNAQDGCLFQDPVLLGQLLAAMSQEKKYGPVYLKISSHLHTDEVDAILAVVQKYTFVDGFVVGNLSKRRNELSLQSTAEELNKIPQGGISGLPIRDMATNLIRHIYTKTRGKYTIIGLGGVFTAEDAYVKIKAGASLVQLVTGLIYGGPTAVKRINRGLVDLLKRDGFATVGDAVGHDARTW